MPMIKNGELLLKKFNFLVLFSILFFCLFSCKSLSLPEENVRALELLDNKSSFYLRIPASMDKKLIEKILRNSVQNLSPKNAASVVERIDTIYVGMIRSRKGATFQLSADCNFPKIVLDNALTKKNGWEKEFLSLKNKEGKNVSYSIFKNQNLKLSCPSEHIVCLGRDVLNMVERYNSLNNENLDNGYESLMQDAYEWLSYEDGIQDNQVRFFAQKPQSFLTLLTGARLNFQLINVRGAMENDPLSDNQYLLRLEFEFKDSRTVPAARGALSLAFGLTDSNVFMESPTHLVVSGIKIEKQSLHKILVL